MRESWPAFPPPSSSANQITAPLLSHLDFTAYRLNRVKTITANRRVFIRANARALFCLKDGLRVAKQERVPSQLGGKPILSPTKYSPTRSTIATLEERAQKRGVSCGSPDSASLSTRDSTSRSLSIRIPCKWETLLWDVGTSCTYIYASEAGTRASVSERIILRQLCTVSEKVDAPMLSTSLH